MDQIQINKQINRIQQILIDSGMDTDKLLEAMKELRALFSAANNPRMTRLSRMALEHIEENDTFLIEMPADEEDDEDFDSEDEVTETPEAEDELTDEQKQIESLDYMLSLMTKPENKLNSAELTIYYDALKG